MPRPFSSNIHQWAKYAVGKNAALTTNSTKQTLSSHGGIARCSEAIIGTDKGVAMRSPFRARPRLGGTRATSSNRPEGIEEILRFSAAVDGFSRGTFACRPDERQDPATDVECYGRRRPLRSH